MYGLKHKHIRIEDQQLNLKMNIMLSELRKKDNISLNSINLSLKVAYLHNQLSVNL